MAQTGVAEAWPRQAWGRHEAVSADATGEIAGKEEHDLSDFISCRKAFERGFGG
jgi:hypothetical protein